MVDDIGIGDGKNHFADICAKAFIQEGLEVNHIGSAIGSVLGIHTVVSCQRDDCTKGLKLCPVVVHHCVESIGTIATGRVFVLDVIRG